MPRIHPAEPTLARDGINPKTGRPWTLADPQVQPELKKQLDAMRRDPQLAKQFFRDVGILTPSGKLSSKYGGK